MNRSVLVILVSLICSVTLAADIIVYGVEDIGCKDTRLFELNITTCWYEEIGCLHHGTDVEAISWMGSQIVGYRGENGHQQKFLELDFDTGLLNVINNSPYTGPGCPEARGMATDGIGTLWAFMAGDGFGTIDAVGDFTLLIPCSEHIEGLAVNLSGTTLYGVRKNGMLFEIDIASGLIQQITDFGNIHIECLEMVNDNEVAFFTNERCCLVYHVYNIVTEQLDSTVLSGVHLNDVEGFVFESPWNHLEMTTWAGIKILHAESR